MHVDSGEGGDVEINLAPVIDCLTVIVAFLLASSSYIAVGILDAGISAGVPAPEVDKPPSVIVSVQIKADQGIVVKTEGKRSQNLTLAAKSGSLDRESLAKTLGELKKEFPDLGGITLSADDSVSYDQVVATMESVRKTVPAVLLGGF